MKSGIYSIKNISNNKIYIGQSVDVKRRIIDHKYLLRKGKHNNTYLQREFNKYGEKYFEFIVEAYCHIDELDEQERDLIQEFDTMNRNKGYNLESGGNLNKQYCEEHKEARRGKGNPMFGKKHSKSFVERITLSNRGSSDLFNEQDVESIKIMFLEGKKQNDIAKIYQVQISTVNKIIKGVNWYWVREDLQNKIDIKIKTDNDIKANAKLRRIKEVESRKKSQETKKEKVRSDFFKGLTKDKIMKKYDISKTTYVRMTSDLFVDRKRKVKEKVFELKASGMMNKNIAECLGLHRTTITEYLKEGSW